jgi:hypothetical protein
MRILPLKESVSSLLEDYQDMGASGKLDLRSGGETCSIYFDSGKPYHATCGDLKGFAAIKCAKTWSGVEFDFNGNEKTPTQTIAEIEATYATTAKSTRLPEPQSDRKSIVGGGPALLKGPTRFFALGGTALFELWVAYRLLSHMTQNAGFLVAISVFLIASALVQVYFMWSYKVS